MSDIVFDPFQKVTLDTFIPELTFAFPDISDDMAMYYIRKAAIEFAKRTRVIKRRVTIHTQACVENYLLESPDCMDIVAIYSVCPEGCNPCGRPVIRLSYEPCQMPWASSMVWFEKPNKLFISPAHDGGIYDIRMAVAPRRDDCELDTVFLDYIDTIIMGAEMYLYAIPNRPWSSINMAQERQLQWNAKLAEAMTDDRIGNQIGKIHLRNRRIV